MIDVEKRIAELEKELQHARTQVSYWGNAALRLEGAIQALGEMLAPSQENKEVKNKK